MAKLLVVHLSDIHISNRNNAILSRAKQIAGAICRDLAIVDGVVVALTGDIAYSGKKDQYELAAAWLAEIKQAIQVERDIPLWAVACPGNHDCDFEAGQPTIRNIVVDSLQNVNPDEIDKQVIETCTSVQSEYRAFEKRICCAPLQSEDPLWTSYAIQLGAYTVMLQSVNVAWMSKRREDIGSIVFPLERFKQVASVPADCTLTLLHHPQNWLSQQSMKPFRRFVRQHSHIVLSGHEHTAGIVAVDEHGAGECVHLEAPALQQHRGDESAFGTVVVDLEAGRFCYSTYTWKADTYQADELDSRWSEYRRLPEKRSSAFALTEGWAKTLHDPGANFRRDQNSLSLGDIYIFPELKPVDTDDKRAIVDAAFLRDPVGLKKGVIVRGGENFGKTALLKVLYQSYQDKGYVPVFLRGQELDKYSKLEVRKTVEGAFVSQYGRANLSGFWSVGADKRVLLIDDIDEFRFPEHKFDAVFEQLHAIFPAHKILTCDELFEYRQLTHAGGFATLHGMHHYQMMEFGHRRRLELVHRWVALGDNQSRGEGEIVGMIDRAESMLTAVIGKNIVPSTPLFLLTILQSIEAGSAGELQNSALGDYYLFLILNSLERLRVPRENFGEIRNYCAHLSWFFERQPDKRASETEFKQFHTVFTDKHALAISFEQRKKLLADAGMLENKDGAYKFRYPYIAYFFVGQYLHEHIDDEEVQTFIRNACRTLHRKDSANSVLFLSHHSRDTRVYESLIAVLSRQYEGLKPMQLDEDVAALNQLVDAIPSLVYEEESVIEKRRRMRDSEDEVERRQKDADALADEEGEHADNPIVALVTMMKTLEILGQFIKNHYGQLEADTKTILISELFEASMRALRGLVTQMIDDSGSLIEQIETVIARRGVEDDHERRVLQARKFVFGILSMIAFAFVRKAAVSVATPNLARVIDKVVELHDSNANRLIKMAIELDSAGGLNLANIQRLNADLKGNAFAQSVLQQAVMLHIHLFKTTDYEKQKVASELNIQVKDQRAIDFVSRKAKRVA